MEYDISDCFRYLSIQFRKTTITLFRDAITLKKKEKFTQ